MDLQKKDYIWPDFDVDSDKIVYLFRREDGNYIERISDLSYKPDDYRYDDVWGLIRIKK